MSLPRFSESPVEVKYWTGFSGETYTKRQEMIKKLIDQLKKYLASGKPVILEWRGKFPPEVEQVIEDLQPKGLIPREI